MNAPTAQKHARLTDAVLCLSVLGLLAFAILISGGGRWIINKRAMQQTADNSTTVDEDCPPCIAAARERERLAAQATIGDQNDDQSDSISDDD